MSFLKRLEALERKTAPPKVTEYATLYIPDITKEEWMGLVAIGSDFSRAELERVIRERDTGKGATCTA